MGWGSGAQILEDIINKTTDFVPKKQRKAYYTELLDIFSYHDCDTLQDVCPQVAEDRKLYEKVLDELFPPED